MSFWLKQFVNKPALEAVLKYSKQPRMFLPTIRVNQLDDLDVSQLKVHGIKYIVFDKDNTLTLPYDSVIHSSIQRKLTEIQTAFPKATAIVSNSAGSSDDVHFEKATRLEKTLNNLVIIRHGQKKPHCHEQVIHHFQQVSGTSVRSEEICVIGDRVMTDVLFGNMHGMMTVLVNPLTYWCDHPVAAVLRILELYVLLPSIQFVGNSRQK